MNLDNYKDACISLLRIPFDNVDDAVERGLNPSINISAKNLLRLINVAQAAYRVIASSNNDHFDDCLCKECLDYTDELEEALKELEK